MDYPEVPLLALPHPAAPPDEPSVILDRNNVSIRGHDFEICDELNISECDAVAVKGTEVETRGSGWWQDYCFFLRLFSLRSQFHQVLFSSTQVSSNVKTHR